MPLCSLRQSRAMCRIARVVGALLRRFNTQLFKGSTKGTLRTLSHQQKNRAGLAGQASALKKQKIPPKKQGQFCGRWPKLKS